jgi:hypothetical protein
MKGKIDKIWQNETADGRRYDVLQIGGEKYSLWDEKYFGRIQEGQVLDFKFRESGDFRNITEIYEPTGQQTSDRKDYAQERLKKIIKMSCLKSASEVLSGSKIPYADRAGKAIEIARRFERYIQDEQLDEATSNPQKTGDE